MRLHTCLTELELHIGLPPDVSLEYMRHGSRKAPHAFEVALIGYGARHTRKRNYGAYAAYAAYAATWSDWGRWLASLYERDPSMACPYYVDAADFHAKTRWLFADDADDAGLSPRTLADQVRAARADGQTITEAIGSAAEAHRLPFYVVKAAIFGE